MATMTSWSVYESPVGRLTLLAVDGRLRRLLFPGEGTRSDGREGEGRRVEEAVAGANRQLDEYFAGAREGFELPLEPRGPDSMLRVWRALLEIPYGETVSYKELAERVERPGEFREIGAAVGRTPLPILIPCHRVVGAGGDLVGYGGGLPRKRALLDLEQGVMALV
jgi:methylated-DNA-[protein]-cysteine S-methyltransferase